RFSPQGHRGDEGQEMMTRMPISSPPRSHGWPRALKRRWLSLAVVALVALGFAFAMTEAPAGALANENNAATAQKAEADFSKFAHSSGAHSRLPCATCHRREGNAPQAIRPGHRPCAGCHSQKFAALGGPICTICHKTAEPTDGALKPPPKLSSFGVRFDHARHASANCASCHKA